MSAVVHAIRNWSKYGKDEPLQLLSFMVLVLLDASFPLCVALTALSLSLPSSKGVGVYSNSVLVCRKGEGRQTSPGNSQIFTPSQKRIVLRLSTINPFSSCLLCFDCCSLKLPAFANHSLFRIMLFELLIVT